MPEIISDRPEGSFFSGLIFGVVIGSGLTIAILGCTAALILAAAVPVHT